MSVLCSKVFPFAILSANNYNLRCVTATEMYETACKMAALGIRSIERI
jgi:hypothetical protein